MLKDMIIPLEKTTKGIFLKRAGIPDNLLDFKEFYATDVAMIAYFLIKNYTEVWEENLDNIKEGLGKLLRLIGSLAEQYGFSLPIIGIIEEHIENVEKDESAKKIRSHIQQWAADQDWHMGEYSLLLAVKNEGEEMVVNLISNANKTWKEIPKYSPISLQQFQENLQREKGQTKLFKEHVNLIDIIVEALGEESFTDLKVNIEQNIDKWVEYQWDSVERLLEGVGES